MTPRGWTCPLTSPVRGAPRYGDTLPPGKQPPREPTEFGGPHARKLHVQTTEVRGGPEASESGGGSGRDLMETTAPASPVVSLHPQPARPRAPTQPARRAGHKHHSCLWTEAGRGPGPCSVITKAAASCSAQPQEPVGFSAPSSCCRQVTAGPQPECKALSCPGSCGGQL